MDHTTETTDLRQAEPVEALMAFFRAVTDWERQCQATLDARKQTQAEFQAAGRKLLVEFKNILANHCVPGTKADRGLSWATPSTYDADLEEVRKVERQTNGKVAVRTFAPYGMEFEYQYVLVEQAGKWLLESRQYVDARGQLVDDNF